MPGAVTTRGSWAFAGGPQATTGIPCPANGRKADVTVFPRTGLRLRFRGRRPVPFGLRLLHVSNGDLLPNNSGYGGLHGIVQLDP